MKKATQYWLVGCGSGCTLVILGIGALIGGSAYFMRSTMEGFDNAVDTRQTLEGEFGEVTDFTPWADGAVPAERMAAFLDVRDATVPAREKLVEALVAIPASDAKARELDDKPFFEKMQSVMDITGSAMGLGARMGQVFEARNHALLEAGMGLGEYTYIYVLAYYVDLGHSIDEHGDGIPMPNIASTRLPEELRKMLRNQLASLEEEGGSEDWKARLAGEVAELESSSRRLPWQDGLPRAIAASLAPYRERLETTWVPEANPLELGRNKRRGSWSIEAE